MDQMQENRVGLLGRWIAAEDKDILIIGQHINNFVFTRDLIRNMVTAVNEKKEMALYLAGNRLANRDAPDYPNPYLVILMEDNFKNMTDMTEEIQNFGIGDMDIVTKFGGHQWEHETDKYKCDVLVTTPLTYDLFLYQKRIRTTNTNMILAYYVDNGMRDYLSTNIGRYLPDKTGRTVVMCCDALNQRNKFFVKEMMRPTQRKIFLPVTPTRGQPSRREVRQEEIRVAVHNRPPGEKILVMCENEKDADIFGQRLKTLDGFQAVTSHRRALLNVNKGRAFQAFVNGDSNVLVVQPQELWKNVDIHGVEWICSFDCGFNTWILAVEDSPDAIIVREQNHLRRLPEDDLFRIQDQKDPKFLCNLRI